ncbi:MAG TPA: PAS domain-containing protein [Pirellulales bacterium]|nr:PAS domain-containing protein [Pirellulales bacterium]
MSAETEHLCLADVESLRLRVVELERALERARPTTLESDERAARRSADILELAIDTLDDGVVITDLHGRPTRINAAGAKIMGIDAARADAVDLWFASAYLPDGCTQYPTNERPLAKALRGESVDGEEILFLHPDTWEALWIKVSAHPLFREDAVPQGVLLVFRDVTLQKRALTALHETERRFRSVIENTPAVVYVKDAMGKYLLINRAFEDISGRARDEIVGRTDRDLFDAATADSLRKNDERVLRSGLPFQFEETVRLNGAEKTYLSVKFPLPDARESPSALCGISTDINQRKHSEELLRSEQAFLKQLIRAHEHDRQLMAYEIHDGLVQYMSASLMHLECVASECLAGEKKPLSSKSRGALELAMHLVRRSIGEGRRVMSGLRPPILDEAGIVLALSYLVAEQAAPGELQIDYQHRVSFERLDPLLEGTIYRIVQEALTNIKRHSRSTTAEVKLLERGKLLYLEIRDWGIGFDTAQVSDDRFGLKGIRKRADLLGGHAKIVSKPGEGTRIIVDLPLTKATT